MDGNYEYIISPDGYEKYGPSDKSQSNKRIVQGFVDNGLMTKDAIYRRYTERLLDFRFNRPSELKNIRQVFRHLREPETKRLSQSAFIHFMTKGLSRFGLTESSGASVLLYEVISWHAFFPFPASYDSSGTISLDETAFVRAICLLWRDRASVLFAPNFTSPSYSSELQWRNQSGSWGPHDGYLLGIRGKDGSDFLRRVFRSLAVPNGIITGNTTTIRVPRFIMYRLRSKSPDGPLEQRIVVMGEEKERSIDIQDVISECPPNDEPVWLKPLRESYSIVLPSLPHQPHDLADLHVPTTKAVDLLKLVHSLPSSEKEPMQDVISLAESRNLLQCSVKARLDLHDSIG
ncbi:hypothetical protein F5Y13DRAFT_193929 [Hypoxylon sp. FL1857]|nr:hypothetical protein F5Y13DRAFT_193929 [Hypoxylon sp. FL1857]